MIVPRLRLRPLAATALTLSACLFLAGTARGAAQTSPPATIRVTANAASQALPFFYARAHGLFRKAGLNVQFTLASTGSADELAVIAGAADIAFTNSLSLTDALAKGIRLKAVAGAEENSRTDVRLLAAPNTGIRTAADLDGKTIGVPGLHDEAWLATMAWADEHGGDAKTLHFIEVPPPLMASALRAHRVSAVTIFDPFAVEMAAHGMRTLGYIPGALGAHYLDTEWVAKASWLANHRAEAVRFAQVMAEAAEYCNAHFRALLPFVAHYSKIPVKALEESTPEIYATSVSPDLLQPVIDAAAKYAHIKRFPASREVFDASPRAGPD